MRTQRHQQSSLSPLLSLATHQLSGIPHLARHAMHLGAGAIVDERIGKHEREGAPHLRQRGDVALLDARLDRLDVERVADECVVVGCVLWVYAR